MRKSVAAACVLVGLIVAGGMAFGHFQTFWPDTPNGYARLGEKVTWQYFWGHPYEMIVFDTPAPDVYAVTPAGEHQSVSVQATTMKDADTGKVRKVYALSYAPESLGDSWLVLAGKPTLIEEEEEVVQDYVKQCVHVMAEVGWDREIGLPIELVPLTRPYGLEEGFAFTARAYMDGKPLPGASVEIEKLNGFYVDGDTLPKDQFGMEDVPMITRAARTNVNGYVTYTLDEPGWWMVSVSAESGEATVEGKSYPRVLRGGLWVHVEKEFTVRP